MKRRHFIKAVGLASAAVVFAKDLFARDTTVLPCSHVHAFKPLGETGQALVVHFDKRGRETKEECGKRHVGTTLISWPHGPHGCDLREVPTLGNILLMSDDPTLAVLTVEQQQEFDTIINYKDHGSSGVYVHVTNGRLRISGHGVQFTLNTSPAKGKYDLSGCDYYKPRGEQTFYNVGVSRPVGNINT